ncbi:hypothetical protein F5B22DRAFT_641968 [Xylaria bambusicola]|uniref:uncharacterized protein n=1 Tax=Xylaria bambusicola TaxID=326684 RepID=UPI002008094D|nr:uncharacterized protein F5B22DRAFT_641968 [Xylaria bambusicola]KAI0525813.1 hypothetical protein F5B22DRAFT_641968 [Xylaria bambusicola]
MSANYSGSKPLPATVSDDLVQTREPFNISDTESNYSDDDADDTIGNGEHKPREVLVGCDQTLRWALATVSPQLADKWRPQINGVDPGSLESQRDRFKTDQHWEKIYRHLLQQFKQHSGPNVSEDKLNEIRKLIDKHKGEIFDHIIDHVFLPIRVAAQEGSAPETNAQAQRKRVNRILKLIKQKATSYELLGVDQDATEKQITAAWKAIITGIHPDRNKDTSAQECAQAVNDAKDVLCDLEKRKRYNAFLEHTPRPKAEDAFGEEFSPNAFDEDDGSDDDALEEDGEEDSEDDDEKDYPPPSKQIQGMHSRMTSRIKGFFYNLEGTINLSMLDTIDKMNKVIEKDNQNRRRTVLTMYEVPRQRLLFFQYAQRRIAVSFELGVFNAARVQIEIRWLQEHFIKTRQRGLYQWPEGWTQLLIEPLRRKLESIGLPREQQMAPETQTSTGGHAGPTSGGGSKAPENEGRDKGKDEYAGESDDDEDDDDEEMEDAPAQNRNRQIQPLRPGFTILGDPILGYMPIQRRSKVMAGETIILGFRVFVKVEGVNPLQVAGGSEIGDAAALAYHQLPEDEKNNIGQNAAKYATMPAAEFVEIIGVTWVPGSSRSDRLPITYVWVRTHTDSGKPEIMTRTTFRQWIGTSLADKYIDSFLVGKGITPEWAALGFPTDPANDSKYLRLTYPPPRQAAHYNLRPRIQYGGFPALQNGGFQGFPTLQNSGGLQGLPAPQREDGGVQELTRKFDQLVELFIRGQEEAREDRKQQREIMSRLLPAP